MSSRDYFFDGVVVDEYSRVAEAIPHYDDLHAQLRSVVSEHLNNSVGNTKVVDLGCGAADQLKIIASLHRGITPLGVDSSESFYQKYVSANDSLVKYERRDILAWLADQKDASVDIFFSGWAFHNWTCEYREKVFGQISRVLKPAGMFVNADKIASKDEVSNNRALQRQLKNFIDIFNQDSELLMSSWILHYVSDENPLRRFTEYENERLHSDYGFKVPEILSRTLMDCVSLSFKVVS
jgi:ubiquinone/menaquinone biosynthesis C-methylase UbiE